ncbi:MAG TPA: thiamine phosphate synthase [Polyangiaceae bacterium]|jgi:thiamine-phosphate pyrophosphorylase
MRPRVVLVTDPAFGDDGIARAVAEAAAALPPGWLCVQLRDKARTRTGLRLFGARLRNITRSLGARLVINGDAVVARDVGADGVHFGAGAGAPSDARRICGVGVWVSVAAHSDEDIHAAIGSGADAVLVSPVFASRPSSSAAPAKTGRGTVALEKARAAVDRAERGLLVYALGGVTAATARRCIDAGADGVAVIREILGNAEPYRAARALHDALARRC